MTIQSILADHHHDSSGCSLKIVTQPMSGGEYDEVVRWNTDQEEVAKVGQEQGK